MSRAIPWCPNCGNGLNWCECAAPKPQPWDKRPSWAGDAYDKRSEHDEHIIDRGMHDTTGEHSFCPHCREYLSECTCVRLSDVLRDGDCLATCDAAELEAEFGLVPSFTREPAL